MNLKEFSKIVKELIKKDISNETYHFIRNLPEGKTNYNFGFILQGKSVKILSPLRSLPVAFEIANRIIPQEDYTLSLRVLSNGKTKTISKTAHSTTHIEELKENMLMGTDVERIFYEILTTDDFEITYSEYEGTIVRFKDETLSRRFLQILIGLFPFVEIERDNKRVEIQCTFEIEKYEHFKKEQKKRGNLKCVIKVDGENVGTKLGSFIF